MSKKLVMLVSAVVSSSLFSMDKKQDCAGISITIVHSGDLQRAARDCAAEARSYIDDIIAPTRDQNFDYGYNNNYPQYHSESTRHEDKKTIAGWFKQPETPAHILNLVEPGIFKAEKKYNFVNHRDLVMSKLVDRHLLIGGAVERLVETRMQQFRMMSGESVGCFSSKFYEPFETLPLSLQSFINKQALSKYISRQKLPYTIIPDDLHIDLPGDQSFIWGDHVGIEDDKRIKIYWTHDEDKLIAMRGFLLKERMRDKHHMERDDRTLFPVFMFFRCLTQELSMCIAAFFNSASYSYSNVNKVKSLNYLLQSKAMNNLTSVRDAILLKELIKREIAIDLSFSQQARL